VAEAEEVLALAQAESNHRPRNHVAQQPEALAADARPPTQARLHMTRAIALGTDSPRPSLTRDALFGLAALERVFEPMATR
jgi:hypothetical protein